MQLSCSERNELRCDLVKFAASVNYSIYSIFRTLLIVCCFFLLTMIIKFQLLNPSVSVQSSVQFTDTCFHPYFLLKMPLSVARVHPQFLIFLSDKIKLVEIVGELGLTWRWSAISRWMDYCGRLSNSVAKSGLIRLHLVWCNSWDVLERVCLSPGWAEIHSMGFSQSISLNLGYTWWNWCDALVGFCLSEGLTSWSPPPGGGLSLW